MLDEIKPMNNTCRCTLTTLVGAIVLAFAVIAVSISAGQMITGGAVNSQPAPSVVDMRSTDSSGRPVAAPHFLNRS